MKKVILVLVSFFLLTGISLSQVVYPRTVFVVWDPNAPVDAVIDYTVVHNNGIANQSYTITASSCTTECRQPLTIPGAAMQTVTVTARNQWASSEPVSVNFMVTAPGRSRNIKISSN